MPPSDLNISPILRCYELAAQRGRQLREQNETRTVESLAGVATDRAGDSGTQAEAAPADNGSISQ